MSSTTVLPQGEPRRLGSAYVLDARIGAGAQGEVWRGHRTESPGAPLAVKLLRAELLDDGAVVERFIKERATLLRVRSPYVVGVRDMVIEGTSFAIVMDFVDGGDLRGLLAASGPLRPAELCRMGALMARGLAAVHDAGIVHRDLKPANVLIDWGPQGRPAPAAPAPAPPPGPGRRVDRSAATVPEALAATRVVGAAQACTPKLADFGVARICDTVSSSHVTGAIGTPLYMAPEILAPQAPTTAADIYSLGVVLYELACGVPPFTGAPAQVLAQHARRDAGRPGGVPDELWNLLAAMLAKHPEARPPAAAVAAELERLGPLLAALPACTPLTEPPASAPSLQPYDWAQEAASTRSSAPSGPAAPSAPTWSSAPSGPTAPSAPVPVGAASAPAAYGSTAAPAAPAAYGSTAVYTGPGPAPGSGPGPRPGRPDSVHPPAAPPRRRRRLIPVIAVVLVVALAGGAIAWWVLGRNRLPDSPSLADVVAAGAVTELQRIPDSSALRVAPDGGALATDDSGTWSLYDLNRSNQAGVWSGECSEAAFWTAKALLCENSGSEASLVKLDGSTSEVPGPVDHNLIGSTATTAVLIDDFSSGSLIGMDSSGKETWRVYGDFSGGRVDNGFLVAYDSKNKQVDVIAADSGAVLLRRDVKTSPNFGSRDEPLPGGVGVDVGPEAFYVTDGSSWTVYDATGKEVRTISSSAPRTSWVSSAPLKAEELADLIAAAPASGGVAVHGRSRTVTVTVDTGACTAAVDGVTITAARPAQSKDCLLTPLGLAGDDDVLVLQSGLDPENQAAKDAVVTAHRLKDGEQTWSIKGALKRVIAPSEQAQGEVASQPRLLMIQGSSYDFNEVLYAVLPE